MRRSFRLFLVAVSLTLAGCAGSPQPVMRTPSGASINGNLPDFSANGRESSGMEPMATANAGRASITPYYQTPAAQNGSPVVNPAPAAPTADLPPVKVGLLVPMSGPQGALGQAMLNAAQLALFDVGATNITLLPHDTAPGAAKAANDVLNEGAQIILGPLFAQDVKAVSPIAASRNIPVIAFSTDWTAVSANTYIMGFLPFGQVSRVVDYAIRNGARNFAALVPQTPYGAAVNGTLKNELNRQRLAAPASVVFSDTMLPQAVQQINNTKMVDSLVLPLGGTQLAQTATLLRQNNWNMRQIHILGTGLWDDAPQNAAIVPGGWYAAPDPRLRIAFTNKYNETYGQNPPRLATLAYDATALAAALAVKGQRENGKPAYDRADLTNPSGFAGLDGVFRFRPDGLAERGLAVLEIRNGGSVVIDPAPTRF